jgi:hypothetical protein
MRTDGALLKFSGAVEHDPAVRAWLDSRPGDLGAIARAWFARIRRCGSDVRELMHDGCATACVDDAPFAYVGVFRAHVNVGFFHGASLADATGLLQGNGKRMRHVTIVPACATDESALDTLVAAAHRDIVERLRACADGVS